MKEDKPHIDQIFKRKLDSRSFDFDDKQWEKMAAILNRQKRWGRIRLFSSIAILTATAVYFTLSTPDEATQPINTSQQNEIIKEVEQSNQPLITEKLSESKLDQVAESKAVEPDAEIEELSDNIEETSIKIEEDKNVEPSSVLQANVEIVTSGSNNNSTKSAVNDEERESNISQQSSIEEHAESNDPEGEIAIQTETIPPSPSVSVPVSHSPSVGVENEPSSDILEENNKIQADPAKVAESSSSATHSRSVTHSVSSSVSQLSDINSWNPLILKSLEKPNVTADLAKPEFQTTEPYSTYVNKGFKLNYGLRAGIGIGEIKGGNENVNSELSTTLYVGGFASYQLHRRWLVDAGVSYAYQEAALSTRVYVSTSYDFFRREIREQLFVNNLHLLEFPIYGTYKLNPSHHISLGIKASYVFAVNGEEVVTEYYGNSITPISNEKFSSSDGLIEPLNWSVSTAYDYQFSPLFRIGLGVELGLNDWKISNEFGDNQAFNNHQLRMRITYLLKE